MIFVKFLQHILSDILAKDIRKVKTAPLLDDKCFEMTYDIM